MSWAYSHILQLHANGEVKFRPTDDSMSPRIELGQIVTVRTYETIGKSPEKGDIVLCKIAGDYRLNWITEIVEKMDSTVYRISDNQGKSKGGTTRAGIYGCVTVIV